MAHNETAMIEVLEKPERVDMPALSRSEDGKVLVCLVKNLDSQDAMLLIVPAVFEYVLAKYENPVGRKFELINKPEREGKNYRNIKVFELTEE